MDDTGARQATPRLREADKAMPRRPFIDGFSAGYMQRSMDRLPRQGDHAPWINPQDYAPRQGDDPNRRAGGRGFDIRQSGKRRRCRGFVEGR